MIPKYEDLMTFFSICTIHVVVLVLVAAVAGVQIHCIDI